MMDNFFYLDITYVFPLVDPIAPEISYFYAMYEEVWCVIYCTAKITGILTFNFDIE